jgi:hypothetical protein
MTVEDAKSEERITEKQIWSTGDPGEGKVVRE